MASSHVVSNYGRTMYHVCFHLNLTFVLRQFLVRCLSVSVSVAVISFPCECCVKNEKCRLTIEANTHGRRYFGDVGAFGRR